MCTNSEMMVTTRSIMTLRPSTSVPTLMSWSPTSNHVTDVSTGCTGSSASVATSACASSGLEAASATVGGRPFSSLTCCAQPVADTTARTRQRPNAAKLMLTALRMSSIDMSTITPLRRASTPYTPMANSAAPRSRNSFRSTALLLPRQDDRAHEGGEEQDRHDLERNEVGGEDGV